MMTNAMTANADALVLQCNDNSNFKPHVPGIWQAMCLDVIDLGLVWTEFQGKRKLVRKLKLVFETEAVAEDGKRGIVTKNFTASLHPKAKLAEFIGKWRGRPVVPGENVDLKKLPGTSCTLVLSHQQSMAGRTYVSIDAVSKAARKVTPSGAYDPVAMRQRIAEWAARDLASGGQEAAGRRLEAGAGNQPAATAASWDNSKSPAATAAVAAPQNNPTPASPAVGDDDIPF
jgi:hypothetical protein